MPQASSVLDVFQAEADAHDAEFAWIAPNDLGQYVGRHANGIVMSLGRYGEIPMSMHGMVELENATLAVQGVGSMHGRLPGIAHQAPAYSAAIRAGE